jgi:hypothetical protein
MTAADWIAVGSAVAAVIAAILTWGQLQVQRSSARGDLQKQFNELISRLAALAFQPASPKEFSHIGKVQALLSEAAGLLGDEGGSRRNRVLRRPAESGPKADPFSYCVLAASYEVVGNITSAGTYWDRGVELSQDDPPVHVNALQEQGRFLCTQWKDIEDIRNGRNAFKEALKVLDARTQGNDTVHEQNASTLLLWAQCVFGLGSGYEAEAVDCVEQAWETAKRIVYVPRRQARINDIAGLAAWMGPEKYKGYEDPELFESAQKISAQWFQGSPQVMTDDAAGQATRDTGSARERP